MQAGPVSMEILPWCKMSGKIEGHTERMRIYVQYIQ